MKITSNNSGTSLYHYSKKAIAENSMISQNNKPMSRKQRRKLERKLSKKVNKYLNENNHC